ncbi:MAG: Smr/MutS family protein, partial [Clostridia bacterium]|nr:Smr/MutS family protein [Clostridia bacterium]
DVMGAGMQFDYKKLKPTYKIVMGVPGASYAFEISERLGLKSDIIASAKLNVDKNKLELDTLLKQAEAHKQEAERERVVATEFKAKAQSEYDKLALQTKKLEEESLNIKEKVTNKVKSELEKYVTEAENAVEEIKGLYKDINENSLLQAKILRTKLSKNIDNLGSTEDKRNYGKRIKPEDLVSGMIVNYKGQHAEVLSINSTKKQVTILVNDVKLDIDINELCYTNETKPVKKMPILHNSIIRASKSEINLIGRHVEDALNTLEEFLDNALLNNLTEIKIIHGFGTGQLRKGIQEYLKKNNYEYRDGGFGEGDRAVTIVTIK